MAIFAFRSSALLSITLLISGVTGQDLNAQIRKIAFWPGLVNVHYTPGSGWATDPDGTAGGGTQAQWGDDGWGDRPLEYCQRFWPNTTLVVALQEELIDVWRQRGNVGGPFTSTKPTYGCISCASTPAATTPTNDDQPCFSETATVEVKEIGKVTMKALQVGDMVLTPSGYEKVYTIDHRSEEQMTEFIQIYTDMEEPLEITANHLIYVQGKKDPVKASSVIVGDKLQGFFEGEMKSVEVESISSISKRGLYNPITESGSIVVNGLVTSTYTAVDISSGSNYVEIAGFKVLSLHDFLHLAMVPFKTVCMSLTNANVCSVAEGNEYNSYDKLGLQLMSFGKSQNVIMQNAILLSILTILCSINIMSSPVFFIYVFLFRTFRKQNKGE